MQLGREVDERERDRLVKVLPNGVRSGGRQQCGTTVSPPPADKTDSSSGLRELQGVVCDMKG